MLTEDIQNTFRRLSAGDTVSGVFLAVPTGEVLKDDPNFIEVLIYNKSYFARMAMPFGSYNIPDKDWLKKYPGEVLLLVAFENGNPAHPVCIGAIPNEGKYPKKAPVYGYNFKTVQYNLVIDDKSKNMELTYDGKPLFKHTLSGVSLLGGTDSAVLGSVLEQFLNKFISIISTAKTMDMKPLDPVTITQLEQLRAEIVKIKSIKVKIE